MKILQVSNAYPPYWLGGYERIARWITHGLQERGHEVAVLTGHGSRFDQSPGVYPHLDLDLEALVHNHLEHGIAFPASFWRGLGRHVCHSGHYRTTRRLIESLEPDIISFWNPAFITFSPLLAARMSGVPAVIHASDVSINVFRNPHPPALVAKSHGLARMLVDATLALARPAAYIVPSVFLRDRFVAQERIDAARLHVHPWPVEPSIAKRPPPAVTSRPVRRVLFVGSLIPEKGVDVLLRALRLAVLQEPALRLTLVGGGPAAYEQQLRELAEGLPVEFRGRLEQEDVVNAYASHDALAFPSVWPEPFAVVPLEAMAMGLPLIASSAGGTPEAVRHGETGWLVRPGDPLELCEALLALARDPDQAQRLAAAGQAVARTRYSFDGFMDGLQGLYQRCVDDGRGT